MENNETRINLLPLFLIISILLHIILCFLILKFAKFNTAPIVTKDKKELIFIDPKNILPNIQKKEKIKQVLPEIKKESQKRASFRQFGSPVNLLYNDSASDQDGVALLKQQKEIAKIDEENKSDNLQKEVKDKSPISTSIDKPKIEKDGVQITDKLVDNKDQIEIRDDNDDSNPAYAKATAGSPVIHSSDKSCGILATENKKEIKKMAVRSLFDKSQKPSFLNLSKGLPEDKGFSDGFNYRGDDTKRPDAQDIKYFSYHRKVINALQNSFNIKMGLHKHSFNLVNPVAMFAISIDKKGELVSVEKVKSGGNDSFDDFIKEVIKYASPFPPIPDFLKEEYFNFVPSFTVYTQHRSSFLSSIL